VRKDVSTFNEEREGKKDVGDGQKVGWRGKKGGGKVEVLNEGWNPQEKGERVKKSSHGKGDRVGTLMKSSRGGGGGFCRCKDNGMEKRRPAESRGKIVPDD